MSPGGNLERRQAVLTKMGSAHTVLAPVMTQVFYFQHLPPHCQKYLVHTSYKEQYIKLNSIYIPRLIHKLPIWYLFITNSSMILNHKISRPSYHNHNNETGISKCQKISLKYFTKRHPGNTNHHKTSNISELENPVPPPGRQSLVVGQIIKKPRTVSSVVGVVWRFACDRQAVSGKFQKPDCDVDESEPWHSQIHNTSRVQIIKIWTLYKNFPNLGIPCSIALSMSLRDSNLIPSLHLLPIKLTHSL